MRNVDLMWLGAVVAFGIPLLVGVLMYLVHEPTYMPNPTKLELSEVLSFSSTEKEGAVNSESMFLRTIMGSFKLADPIKYEKIEVLVALYDDNGELLNEYFAGKENIERTDGIVTFEIAVYEPHGMFSVSGYEYTVQGE